MLKLSAIFLIVSIGYGEAAVTKPLPTGIVNIIRDAAIKCLSDNIQYDQNLVVHSKTTEFGKNDAIKQVLLCSLVTSGFAYETGHIKLKKIAKYFPEEVQKVIVECDKAEGVDAVDTTINFVKCFGEKSPIHYSFEIKA